LEHAASDGPILSSIRPYPAENETSQVGGYGSPSSYVYLEGDRAALLQPSAFSCLSIGGKSRALKVKTLGSGTTWFRHQVLNIYPGHTLHTCSTLFPMFSCLMGLGGAAGELVMEATALHAPDFLPDAGSANPSVQLLLTY